MEMDSLYYSSTATSLPARHFPAFAAADRVGGGFRVEGRHSNAAYNRHLTNVNPRAAAAAHFVNAQGTTGSSNSSSNSSSSCLSLSPEHVNAAAQAGLAQAAALADTVSLKSGTWDHVLCSSSHTLAAADPAAACTASQEAAASSTAGDGSVSSMPTTYCCSQVLQHSQWLHDGTDFTRGHMEQVLKCRPSSAPAAGHKSHNLRSAAVSRAAVHSRSAAGLSSSLTLTSRLMQLKQQRWEAKQGRSVTGVASDELQALLDRTSASQDRSSWFSHTPVQVLKIEREKQQAAEQAWLSEFHPVEGAKYPNRSAGLHSSRGSLDSHHRSCGGYGSMQEGTTSRGLGSGHCSSAGNSCGQQGDACDASKCVVYPDDDETEGSAMNGGGSRADGRRVFEQEDAALEQQQQQQQANVTEEVAAECAAAREAAAAAAAARNAPAPAWWEANELLAQRINQLLQPNTRGASHCCSATLNVYDALLAANADRAAQLQATGQLGGQVLLQQLQTPQQLHDAWVAELGGRSTAQRLHQVLAEAAGVR